MTNYKNPPVWSNLRKCLEIAKQCKWSCLSISALNSSVFTIIHFHSFLILIKLSSFLSIIFLYFSSFYYFFGACEKTGTNRVSTTVLFFENYNVTPNKHRHATTFCTLLLLVMMCNACWLWTRCNDQNGMCMTNTILMQWLSESNKVTEWDWCSDRAKLMQ